MQTTLQDSEDVYALRCEICGKRLAWLTILGEQYPLDATAEADCCNRAYVAYSTGFKVYSFNPNGN